jgi:hypothetical protein
VHSDDRRCSADLERDDRIADTVVFTVCSKSGHCDGMRPAWLFGHIGRDRDLRDDGVGELDRIELHPDKRVVVRVVGFFLLWRDQHHRRNDSRDGRYVLNESVECGVIGG